MDLLSASLFLATGLGLGLIHAFDPDHLAAVGALGAEPSRSIKPRGHYWQYALRWSLGHGVALLALAALVFVLGLPIPDTLSHFAELTVAFLLIILGGLSCLGLFLAKPPRIFKAFNESSALFGPIHKCCSSKANSRAGVMGVVHGTAGSASLFALIPLAKVSSMSFALSYVLSFSAGVALAMLTLGFFMNQVLDKLSRYYRSIHHLSAFLFSFSAICLGLFLLLS